MGPTLIERRTDTMKRISLILLFILGFAAWSFAGKIYGGITEGGKPVTKGVKVDVTCGAMTHSAETDANGAFSLMVPEQGKCTMKVTYQGHELDFTPPWRRLEMRAGLQAVETGVLGGQWREPPTPEAQEPFGVKKRSR